MSYDDNTTLWLVYEDCLETILNLTIDSYEAYIMNIDLWHFKIYILYLKIYLLILQFFNKLIFKIIYNQ